MRVLVVVVPSTSLVPVSGVPPISHVMEGAVEQSLAVHVKDISSPVSKHAPLPKSPLKDAITARSKQNERKK